MDSTPRCLSGRFGTCVGLCLFVAVLISPVSARAQSAGTVIERHINAIGGKKAVERVVSSQISGRVTSADGRSGVFQQRTMRPHLFSVSMAWADARWRVGFNGRSAWQDDSVEGVRTLYGEAASRVRAEARYANTRLLMSESVLHAVVSRRDELRGRAVIVVTAIAPDGAKHTLFFDAGSYLLVKDEQQTDRGLEERFFDDYRSVDHVLVPHRIEWRRNGETLTITVERVAHNASVEAGAFDVPVSPSGPQPAADDLLSGAERSEQHTAGLRTAYAYTTTSASERIDEDGRITRHEGETSEVFRLGDRVVSRLITKRGGEPLSEAERRSEDERIARILQEYERQRASGQANRPASGARSSGMVMFQAPTLAAASVPAYRRMSAFSNVRRERDRGRAVLVMDFEGKRGVASRSDQERQISAQAGTVWLDEASQHVVRMESYFVNDDDRTIEGSSVTVEYTLLNDEVWLLSRVQTNARTRFAFGNRPQFRTTSLYTDYKKFSVATDSNITLPDPGQ